jgi:hypothetical protein
MTLALKISPTLTDEIVTQNEEIERFSSIWTRVPPRFSETPETIRLIPIGKLSKNAHFIPLPMPNIGSNIVL